MAPLHRHNPRLGVVFFRLQSHSHAVLFMFLLLFFHSAAILQQWAREQHSNWWRDDRKTGNECVALLHSMHGVFSCRKHWFSCIIQTKSSFNEVINWVSPYICFFLWYHNFSNLQTLVISKHENVKVGCDIFKILIKVSVSSLTCLPRLQSSYINTWNVTVITFLKYYQT